MKSYLEENPDIMDKIEGLLLDTLKKDNGEDGASEEKAPEGMMIDEDGVIIED